MNPLHSFLFTPGEYIVNSRNTDRRGAGSTTVSVPLSTVASNLMHADVRLHTFRWLITFLKVLPHPSYRIQAYSWKGAGFQPRCWSRLRRRVGYRRRGGQLYKGSMNMMETRDVKLESSTFYKHGVEIDFTNVAAIRQYALTCSKILRLLHDIYQNQENWGCFRTKCIANL